MAINTCDDVSAQSFDEPIYIDGRSHLEDVTTRHDVVLVDFYADWCGPCQMLNPVIEDLAGTTEAVIAKVDVDEHQQLAGSFGVRGVPTLVFFAGGEQVEQQSGVLPEDRLRTLIERYTE